MAKYRTKEGTYGTMHLFEVHYRDRFDPDNPFDRSRFWAYEREGAVDRFYESLIADDGEDFTILSVKRVREGA